MVPQAATELRGLKGLRAQLELPVRKETKVNKVYKVSKVRRALLVLRVKLELRVIQAQWDLQDLKAKPAPLVRRASKVLPVQLGQPVRRVTRDLWVLWDQQEKKVVSVLLDLQVLWERRAQRAQWVLMVALLTSWRWLMALLAQNVPGLTRLRVRTVSQVAKEQTEELG
jgi:hypothetical protein